MPTALFASFSDDLCLTHIRKSQISIDSPCPSANHLHPRAADPRTSRSLETNRTTYGYGEKVFFCQTLKGCMALSHWHLGKSRYSCEERTPPVSRKPACRVVQAGITYLCKRYLTRDECMTLQSARDPEEGQKQPSTISMPSERWRGCLTCLISFGCASSQRLKAPPSSGG